MSERKKLTLDELRETMEFKRLTQKQQLFVAAYCDGGLLDGNYDPVAATRIAYLCKSPKIANVLSYQLLSNIKIIAAINRHLNLEPLEDLIAQIDRAVMNGKITHAQVEALRLKSAILGFVGRSSATQTSALGITPKGTANSIPNVETKKRGRPRKDAVQPVSTEPPTYAF